ncbi:hypothetical protein CJI97_002450 [Candidozyma auris]|uniref:Zn(2)-C6 fungal-type domain-containing protein n=1 Tax=Candidozyma auris TaxID=498019 RepID=A0A2H0ZQ41_CANAR|nr:hypothetical protein CJI97_002450 [[Candida] auris]PIS55685.1 hypothetical protein B9J08_001789 [[Candida] auris]
MQSSPFRISRDCSPYKGIMSLEAYLAPDTLEDSSFAGPSRTAESQTQRPKSLSQTFESEKSCPMERTPQSESVSSSPTTQVAEKLRGSFYGKLRKDPANKRRAENGVFESQKEKTKDACKSHRVHRPNTREHPSQGTPNAGTETEAAKDSIGNGVLAPIKPNVDLSTQEDSENWYYTRSSIRSTKANQAIQLPVNHCKATPSRRVANTVAPVCLGRKQGRKKTGKNLKIGGKGSLKKQAKSAVASINCSKQASKSTKVVREYYGCWTCRVRHVSCPADDEPCKTCRQLGIVCDMAPRRPDYLNDAKKKASRLAFLRETRKISPN